MKRMVVGLGVVLALILGWIAYRNGFSPPAQAVAGSAARSSSPSGDDGSPRPDAVPVAVSDAEETNQRTRPEPRPEDKKHPTPPAPVAVQVGGKPGFVLSPFNDKIIDVTGLPPGTLVQDPTYPPEEKRYFRVP